MVTVADSLPPHKSHHRAFGAQRPTTPAQRARYIAESIALHSLCEDDLATWARYCLTDNPEQQTRVRVALAQLR
jgi:hypothetical protein